MKAFIINLKDRPERLKQFNRLGLPLDVEIYHAERNKDGSMGCIKSHLECFKMFGDGINIVFEDDCRQVADIQVMFKAFEELEEWDILYLGAMVHGDIAKNTEHTDRVDSAWTTHAIAYNGRKVSDHLLKFKAEEIQSLRRNIDTFIVYEIQRSEKFKCYITNPQIFIQELNFSDVINDVRDYEWKYGNRI